MTDTHRQHQIDPPISHNYISQNVLSVHFKNKRPHNNQTRINSGPDKTGDTVEPPAVTPETLSVVGGVNRPFKDPRRRPLAR